MKDDDMDDHQYGVRRLGPIELTIEGKKGIERYARAFKTGAPVTFTVAEFRVSGFVTNIVINPSVDGNLSATVTLQPTGAPMLEPARLSGGRSYVTALQADGYVADAIARAAINDGCAAALGAHPNCRCASTFIRKGYEGDSPVKKTIDPKPKKFYVGHTDTILNRGGRQGWAKDTLPDAIAHATERAESTGEPQYIVKVIKVVRRKPQPIVVEDVK